jgi:hypothetical protein
MELELIQGGAHAYLAGRAGQAMMSRADDVTEIVGECFSNGTRRVLLYAENLPPGFVDLSSGAAGVVQQKLEQYRLRTAIVLDLAATPHSQYFADMVLEANRGQDVRYFAEPAAAVAWLLAAGA